MIEYIKGTITSLTPTAVTVETVGIGYQLNVSLPTYEKLQAESNNSTVKLLVHEVIREDAWTLFGFLSERERTLFRQLIGVSGVGANTARVILSAYAIDELEGIIASGNVAQLKKVKGIGAKTAERIIVDLKDKIKADGQTLNTSKLSTE
ncbi:MAG: Holliday junction branch migration protein RuvA, partial [Muribaculum sp.]|nr:Holliday junction branch migration protein RuvA [Muribaculum sp.]